MIRRYQFCAPSHHQFQAGAEVHFGGDTFELEDSLATDPRLVCILREEDVPSGSAGEIDPGATGEDAQSAVDRLDGTSPVSAKFTEVDLAQAPEAEFDQQLEHDDEPGPPRPRTGRES